MVFLDELMKDCALECSDKLDMRILQRHLYIGIISDTLKGRILIGKGKFNKLPFNQSGGQNPRSSGTRPSRFLTEQYEKEAEVWPLDPRTILFK